MTRPLRSVGSAVDALPASVARVSGRHQRSPIPWSRLGDNPGTTSSRSIRTRERARLSTSRGVGSKARNAASTALRLRTGNVARRISARVRGPVRAERAIARTRAPTSGAPSTCNPARLRICESVGMQRFWVGGRCQPRSVLRRFAIRPSWQLGSEGSARRVYRWRTQPPARSCDVKLALENLVVLERNSATRVGLTGVVKTAHGRGGRRHSGEGQSPR